MSFRILVVDDEKMIVKGIRFALEQEGMEVECAYDGEEAIRIARSGSYDTILLDVMLPKFDGFEVCRAIREFSNTPIIMLTAKDDDMNKIEGLECGADDYIVKPFNIKEVIARIKAIHRRIERNTVNFQGETLKSKDMRLDISGKRCFICGKEYNLTAKEFDVLELLMRNPGIVYSREKLLELVWGSSSPGDVRTVDVHIRRLREKIEEDPGEPRFVHTKWGVGYYFEN